MQSNPESLDSSIQSALSALFPPFEVTAPIVLSQLFRTIEERYHGDALQCLLDFLIPSKHLLESVQQAACAGYSDVVFRCEGWPLCLHDKTVIQLAPINPLLLRPGDFYLQVEPFGDQAARIVLKSLLEQGCREVEETPVPETSYPCIFTEDWLHDINEGRHGTPLSRCLLCTDQGVIKLPWAKVAIPEFLDKPKIMPTPPSVNRKAPPEPIHASVHSHFNSSTLPLEMVFPSKERMSASLRPADSSSKLIKMHREKQIPNSKPFIKPVGWVSPNTWDSRNYPEIEGDYVDLVDIVKGKEVMDKNDSQLNPSSAALYKPVRPAPPPPPFGMHLMGPCGSTLQYAEEPCVPYSQKGMGYDPSDQDLKCRYRESYLAALKNPVPFEKGSVDLLAALEEVGVFEEGELKSQRTSEAQRDEVGIFGNHCKEPTTSHECVFACPSVSVLILRPALYKNNCITYFSPSVGSRDRTGRAVVEVHGDRKEWTSPLLSAHSVCELLLYLHNMPRKDVRELGMTLAINARKKPPPSYLYKALLMAQEQALHAVHSIIILVDKDTCPRPEKQSGLQMDTVSSMKALNKTVEASQLTSELGGTFPYSHTDWLQFHQKLVSFMADLRGADNLLQKAIKKVDGIRKMDTAEDVQKCIEEQKASMKEVLEDVRLVTLQREGGAVLARMRREEFRFRQSEDYRDALESMTCLYNQVEEKLHALVMRSNKSLQHLEFLFTLREMEAKISEVLTGNVERRDGKYMFHLTICHFLQEKQQYSSTLVMEAERIVSNRESSPATDVFLTLVSTFKSNMDDFMLRAEKRHKELDTLVYVHRFCDQASSLAKECSHFLEQVEQGCYTVQTHLSTLQMYEERLGGEFSTQHFQALKAKACAVGSGVSGVMRVWNAAWVQCQEVKKRLEEMQKQKKCLDKKQIQQTTSVDYQGNAGGMENKREKSEVGGDECSSNLQPGQKVPISHNQSLHSGHMNSESRRNSNAEEGGPNKGCTVSTQSPKDLRTPETLLTQTENNGSNVLKLQKIIEELLSTEREYVKALGYVREHYFPELERADVPQDLRGQRGSIFGNLEKLHDFHRHHFLNELESCVNEPFRVGRCFLRHRDSFALYALYSKNKPQSDSLLINHGQTFFKQKQLKLGDKMDLWSYLLKPVQRISKYSLLLQDVMKECGPGQVREMAEVKAALEVVHFQLRHGNNLLAMDAIHHCDVNLKEQGQLIRQDEFVVTFRKKKCCRHIFLFQELILFSKTKKTEVGNETYIYKQSFKTSDVGMTQNCGDSGLCFEIWFRKRKTQDTYMLQASSREVKEAWTKDLERILWEQAVRNREVRMQERVFLGIGNKPFMDIKPSEAAINNRAVNYVLIGRGGRQKSVGSASSSSSSSSSGRGSLSPVGYLCGSKRGIMVGGLGGYISPPGLLEEDDLDHENGCQNLLCKICDCTTTQSEFRFFSSSSSK
uniref:Quattro n=1 Tax=Sphaeramia orbicularis TaxID=375764 RepID=A0A672ZH05_9TELE